MKGKSFAILLCGIALVAGTAASGGLIFSSYISKEAKAATATWTQTAVNGQNNTFPKTGTNTFDNVTYTLAFQNSSATVGNYNTQSYEGVQMGSSSTKTGIATFTFENPWGGTGTYKNYTNISKITIIGNSGESNGTPVSATIGGQSATGSTAKFVKNTSKSLTTIDFVPAVGYDTGTIVISVNATTAAWYFKSISITASEVEAPAKVLTNISVEGTLSKTSYYVGENFDPTGLTINATYDDLSVKDVTNLCTFTHLTDGLVSVTATYIEGEITKTATIEGISVVERSITAISVGQNPTKMVYTIGQAFNPAGMKINATFDMGPVNNDYKAYSFAPSAAFDTLGNKTITITSNDNISITTSLVVEVIEMAEGTYTIKTLTTTYRDPMLVADLDITKTEVLLGDLTIDGISNTRLNSNPNNDKTITIGGNATTGGKFTVTLPDGLYASSVTFNGLLADSGKTPTLKINDGVRFVYSSSMTSATLHPYANSLEISTLPDAGVTSSRIWTTSIEIVAKTVENAALDFGTYLLEKTNAECASLAVKSSTWSQIAAAYNGADSSIKSIIDAAEPILSGNDLEQAMARYDYIVGKYSYSDFLEHGVASINRNVFVNTPSNTTFLFLSFATIIVSGTCLYFLLKKKKAN